MIISLLLGLLLGASVLIFTFQNVASVNVAFLTWHFDGSLALILVLAVVIGMVLNSLFVLPDRMKKRSRISRLETETDQLRRDMADKENQVEIEKNKLAANNAYLDEKEKI